MAICWY